MADLADVSNTIPIQSAGDSLDERRFRPLPASRRERAPLKKEPPAEETPTEGEPTEQDDHQLDVTA